MSAHLCEGHRHQTQPPAEYVADWHGCRTTYTCRECLAVITEAFAGGQVKVRCTGCDQPFMDVHSYVTWRPL